MNTAKTKTLIVVLLVAVNLFFIYNIIKMNDEKSKISARMIDDTIAILNSRGIVIDKSIIVRKKPFYKAYEGSLSKKRDTENYIISYKEIATRITGAEIKEEPLHLPDGTLYIAGDYKFKFLNGESDKANMFAVSIIKNEYENLSALFDMEPLEPKIRELLASGKPPSGKNRKEAAEALNRFFGGYKMTENNYRILYADKQYGENKICAVINQTHNNLSIASNYVYVEICENEVAYFRGNYFFHDFTAGYDINLFDSVNLLLNISAKENNILKNNSLVNMELVYYPSNMGADNFYLLPMWRLEFADGSSHIFHSLTGEETGL